MRPDRVTPKSGSTKRVVGWVVGFVLPPPEAVMGDELVVSVDLETMAVAIRE